MNFNFPVNYRNKKELPNFRQPNVQSIKFLVDRTGLEPVTSTLQMWRSTK